MTHREAPKAWVEASTQQEQQEQHQEQHQAASVLMRVLKLG
jgi:hypothetical protein